MNDATKLAIRERINKLERERIDVERHELAEGDWRKWAARFNEIDEELADLHEDLDKD